MDVLGNAYAKPTELRRESSMPIDQYGPKDHEALRWRSVVQQPTSTELAKDYFELEGRTYATVDPSRKIGAQNDRADLCCVGRGESL